jgi:tetratricopeptide (TPR) repeat protein
MPGNLRLNVSVSSIWKPRSLFAGFQILIWILLLGFPAWAGVGGTGAEFLKLGGGARPLAMGEAYTALADDSSSIFWNPAGLAKMSFPEMLYMYDQWFIDIKHQYFDFAFPSLLGTFGTGYSVLDSGDIAGFGPSGEATGNFKTAGSALTFSWARKFSDHLSLGFNLKSISEQLESKQAAATALDCGLLYDLDPRFSLGMVVANIGPPLKFIAEETPLPRTIRIGAAMRDRVWGNKLNLAADYVNYADGTGGLNVGAEYLLKEMLSLRAGSSRGYLRAGVGIASAYFSFDYAYLSRTDLGSAHQVSMSYSLGSEDRQKALAQDYLSLAKANYGGGQYAEAIVVVKKALAIDPELAEAKVLLDKANAALEAKAAGKVETLIRVEKMKEIDIYLANGKRFMAVGKYLEAIDEFSKALQVDPSYPEAVKLVGQAQAALGKELGTKVKKEIEQRLGRARNAISTGDYKGALSETDRVLEMDPGNVEALKLKRRLMTILKITKE